MKRDNRNGWWSMRGRAYPNYASDQFHELQEWWPLGKVGTIEFIRWKKAVMPAPTMVQTSITDTRAPGLYTAGTYADLSSPPTYSSMPLTISCWIEPAVFTGSHLPVWLGASSAWTAFGIEMTSTSLGALHGESAVFAKAEVMIPVPLRKAIHLVGVFESLSSRKLYRNGILVAANSTALASAGTKDVLRLGAGNGGGGGSFAIVSDLRVYRGALSPERIWEMFDPATRFDLYREYRQRVFVIPAAPQIIAPPFIASTASLFAPMIVGGVPPDQTIVTPFISSAASVFAPTIAQAVAGSEVGTSVFPDYVDEARLLLIASNNAAATLSGALNAGTSAPFALTLTGDLSNFADSGAITIDVGDGGAETSEILYFDGKAGQVLSITKRAQDGTIAHSFSAGATVEMREIARHHNLVAETLIAVETEVLSQKAEIESHASALADKLSTSGGTMTGPLILSGAPAVPLHAANKAYVDNLVITGGTGLPYGTFWVSAFGASGSAVTTLGSITVGQATLTVASTATFAVGQGIFVAGAGVGGANLISSIIGISGSVITLAHNASTSVPSVLVQHDDTVAIQTAINQVSTIHSLTLLFDNGTYRINGPINATSNSILTVPHSPYNSGIARTLRMFGQSTMMADVLSTPSPQGTIIQSDQTGTDSNTSIFNLGAPYLGSSFFEMFFTINNLNVDIRDMYWRTHNNPRISAIDLWMGWNMFLTNVTVDTGHNPQGSLGDDTLAGAEPTHGTFGIRLPRVSTLSQTNNVSITNYAYGLIYHDLFHSISLFIQRCKTAMYTRGYDYPTTGMILIVQCATGIHIEGNAFGRPGLDCTIKWEIDARGLGNWWESIPNRYIYDPTNVLFGQLKYYVVATGGAGMGSAITVTGSTALTKTNLHA